MARILKAVLALAVAMPLAAQAQTDFESDYRDEGVADPSIGIMGDVGVGSYNRDFHHEVKPGVGYGATLDFSPIRNMGVEVAYRGGVNHMEESLTPNGRIITNQLGGNLKFNLVPARYDLPGSLRPFIFAGAFWHRVDTDGFTPGISDDLNAFALPVGAGLEAAINDRFLVGARFTYNFLFNETDSFSSETDWWMASVNLGARLGN